MSEEAKSTTTTKVITGEENKVQDSHQDEQKIVDTTNNLDNTTFTTRKQRLESITTSGMNGEQRTIDAFYEVMWPILEKEGGWTLVRSYYNSAAYAYYIKGLLGCSSPSVKSWKN